MFHRDTLRSPLTSPPHKHSSEVYIQYPVVVKKFFSSNNSEPTDSNLLLRFFGLTRIYLCGEVFSDLLQNRYVWSRKMYIKTRRCVNGIYDGTHQARDDNYLSKGAVIAAEPIVVVRPPSQNARQLHPLSPRLVPESPVD